MKKVLAAMVLLMCSVAVFADEKATYLQLLQEDKLDQLLAHLQQWEKKTPKNPELYIAFFNYHLRKGSKSGISLDKYAKDSRNNLAITDPKTNKIVGYLNDSTYYDSNEVKLALQYLDKGLVYGPNRLDMYFGKVSILGKLENMRNNQIQ